MRVEQLTSCPFCGVTPARHDSVGPSGFAWSAEEEQIFMVACMTKDCPPSGIYLPDQVWNFDSQTQAGLMDGIFATMEAEKSPDLEERREYYKAYLKRLE